MELYWGIAAGSVAFIVIAFWVATYVRTRRLDIAPLIKFREGAFLERASARASSRAITPQLPGTAAAYASMSSGGGAPLSLGAPAKGAITSGPVDKAAWAVAVGDGVIPAAEVWLRWYAVDDHVFQAFQHLSHQQIDGVADLLRLVDAKAYAIESDGFFNMLLGHVGEWHALEHLHDAGIPAAMAYGANQAGYDVVANGHEMNVKTVQDAAAAARAHFSSYPDTPIIVPGDAAHIPADALHFDPSAGFDTAAVGANSHQVIVDVALSHAEVADQTQTALDVLADPGAHAHFPWVTAAVSTFRESKLYLKGNTDLARAAKNVGVDTAAVGGGGLVGMKAGAALGTMVGGPVGTVLGGIAGSIVGSLSGRALANSVKRAPLDTARQEYEQVLAIFKAKEEELGRLAASSWEEGRSREALQLRLVAARLKKTYDDRVLALRQQLEQQTCFSVDRARRYLASAQAQLETLIAGDEARLGAVVPRWLRPLSGVLAPREALTLARHSAECQWWRKRSEELLTTWSCSAESTVSCFDLLLAVSDGEKVVDEYLSELERLRQSVLVESAKAHQEALKEVVTERAAAVSRLRQHWAEVVKRIEEAFAPFLNSLKTASEAYRSELKKAGLEPA